MVLPLILAALSALTIFSAYGETPPGERLVRSLGIYIDFDIKPGNVSLEAMKKEVDAIMKPTGLQLIWRLLSENRGTESFSDLVVFRFKGKCAVDAMPADSEDFASLVETVTLGSTRVSGGRVLPFSEVQCDQVRKSIPYIGPGANHRQKQLALGRALGCVVAHELYHVLVNTTRHAANGLARASETWKDLISGALTFQDRDSRAMRGTRANSDKVGRSPGPRGTPSSRLPWAEAGASARARAPASQGTP